MLKLAPEVRDGITVETKDGKTEHIAGINDLLAEHFGTPTEPAVWTLLPLDFGGEPTSVTKVVSPSVEVAEKAEEDEQPFGELTVAIEPLKESASIAPGATAAWTKGTYKGRSFRIASLDPKAGSITLAGKFDEGLPKEGDKLLVGAGSVLEHGQELYARHCIHCHGPGGAGDGPTGRYLEPKPRDYRLGKFKFTSTAGPEKASSKDLLDILKQGVPGTSMPAFRLLSNEELHALVEYVRWLATRGEYEIQLATTVASYGYDQKSYDELIADGDSREDFIDEVKGFLEDDLKDESEIVAEGIGESWENADDPSAIVEPTVPRVADTPESRARGRALYLTKKAQCASCHGVYGKGDGPLTFTFWKDPATNKEYPRPGLHDDWHNPIQPRDLTQNIYRGGRRPIDVFRRIHAGIKGTPMPRFGGSLTEEEIWDIVNYVLHVPYDPLPAPGRGEQVAISGH
jgi:mono/diheme cytochrome c family protein